MMARGLLFAALLLVASIGQTAHAEGPPARLRAALLTAAMGSDTRLVELRDGGYSTVVLAIDDDSAEGRLADREAAQRVAAAGLDLWYWIEIARCPKFADEHPEWMASLQGHLEWRRFFKDFPYPKPGEVVKNYPWVPILYREAFEAHLARVKQLLAARPPAKGILLNDLQGPPSACGCGNPVCRWTADYGPIKTATPLGDDAAARFVTEVEKLAVSGARVIPNWTTECEAHDVETDALCAGVGCFKGICWKAYTRQLRHVADQSPTIGALLLYKDFGQDTRAYPESAGWIGHALRGFQTLPVQNGGPLIEAPRLLPVLQGWNVTADELAAQETQATTAGAAGFVVALARIDQSWSPRLLTAR